MGVIVAPWGDGDLPLLQALLGDPAMMAFLGGPETPEKIRDRHVRYAADPAQLRISVDGEPAGWVGYWPRTWRGHDVYEVGWAVAPGFQGRGVARAAVTLMLAQAAGEREYAHAFPKVDNVASNLLCERTGFELLGPCDFEYPPGTPIVCNDWRARLAS